MTDWTDFWLKPLDRAQNEAIADLRTRNTGAAALEQRVALLEEDNRELRRAILRLSAGMNVVIEALVTSGTLDMNEVRQNIASAMSNVDAPPPGAGYAPPTTPRETAYRGARPTATKARLVACSTCNAQVAETSTHVTADGVQCDPCFTTKEIARLAKIETEG